VSVDLFERCEVCGVEPCACAQIEGELVGGEAVHDPRAEVEAAATNSAAIGAIVASAAQGAFTRRRIEQLLERGHSPASDRDKPLDHLPRQALTRIRDAIDKLGSEGGNLEYAKKKIEVAGACLLAAWDAIEAARKERGDG
jgi:hypothetical protein